MKTLTDLEFEYLDEVRLCILPVARVSFILHAYLASLLDFAAKLASLFLSLKCN